MNFALGAVWLAFTTALLVTLGSTSAHAEDCSQYPPSSYRAQCVAAQNPKIAAKIERCRDEARAMGLRGGRGDARAFNGYVEACVKRR